VTSDPLLDAIAAKRDELDRHFQPLESTSDVRGAIHRELAKLGDHLARPAKERSWVTIRAQLVAVAATCCRGCRDLGLETVSAAAEKDIPF
jgi:hypothetical protein